MKREIVYIGLFAILFIIACGDIEKTSDIKSFDTNLYGTWVSNDPSVYSGTLEIDFDHITIKGYSENQTQSGKDDSVRPFRNFTKGIPLKGYSEDGKLFIQDSGVLQEGIPYTYWEESPPPDYNKSKFLRFTFSNRVERLQKE